MSSTRELFTLKWITITVIPLKRSRNTLSTPACSRLTTNARALCIHRRMRYFTGRAITYPYCRSEIPLCSLLVSREIDSKYISYQYSITHYFPLRMMHAFIHRIDCFIVWILHIAWFCTYCLHCIFHFIYVLSHCFVRQWYLLLP